MLICVLRRFAFGLGASLQQQTWPGRARPRQLDAAHSCPSNPPVLYGWDLTQLSGFRVSRLKKKTEQQHKRTAPVQHQRDIILRLSVQPNSMAGPQQFFGMAHVGPLFGMAVPGLTEPGGLVGWANAAVSLKN